MFICNLCKRKVHYYSPKKGDDRRVRICNHHNNDGKLCLNSRKVFLDNTQDTKDPNYLNP